jgi:adenine-specific DNA-methyltransferase
MNAEASIETEYINSVSHEHREKYAQFFTPLPVASLMANWLLGSESIDEVLEPAFGLGIFARTLLESKPDIHIEGYEIDSVIYKRARDEFSDNENVTVLLKDYMFNGWDKKYDGIICNPPYFKFHDYDNATVLKEIEKRLKYRLSGFTNLYTLFLLKSLYQLNPNGRCAYIVPSEFLNSDYGKAIKDYLVKTKMLRHIIVIDFAENVFDDALTTASIILCANDDKTDKVQFTNIRSLQELPFVERLIIGYPSTYGELHTYSLPELDPEIKWKVYYQQQNGYKFNNLVPFSNYAKVVRGIATGANNYFTFNVSKAEKYSIDEQYLLPCICHSIDVRGNHFTESDFYDLKNKDKNVFLIDARDYDDKNVGDYLRKGEDEQIHLKFLTASRNPWYSLEKRQPAPIWVGVFNRTGLRFVRNEANVSNLTTFHCVYPQTSLFSDVSVELLFAYLLTNTARKIFEDNAREYGNGLQKFEPNDLNKGKMLDINRLPTGAKQKIEYLYSQYRLNHDQRCVDEIDDILVQNFSGAAD